MERKDRKNNRRDSYPEPELQIIPVDTDRHPLTNGTYKNKTAEELKAELERLRKELDELMH